MAAILWEKTQDNRSQRVAFDKEPLTLEKYKQG